MITTAQTNNNTNKFLRKHKNFLTRQLQYTRKILSYCIAISVIILNSSCGEATFTYPTTSSNGIFDLSNYDFSSNEVVPLDGQWHFYWNELLTPTEISNYQYTPDKIIVPHDWHNTPQGEKTYPLYGYATYQTRIKIPKNAPPLAISTPFIPTSATIFINDQIIVQNGKVAKNKADQEFNLLPVNETLPEVGEEFTLTIQLSNYDMHKSGILHSIYLGNAEHILSKLQESQFYNLLIAGGTLFLGVFLMLTIFLRYFDRALFYFGLFIASFGYWKSSTSKVFNYFFEGWDWVTSLKIEFICVFLFNLALIGFFKAIYPRQNWFNFVYGFQILELVLILLTIFLPISYIFPMVGYHIYLIGILLLYLSFVAILALKAKAKNIVFTIWAIVSGIINFIIYILQDQNIWDAQEVIFFIVNIILLFILGLLILHRLLFDFSSLTQRAAIAGQAKSRFLSVVSHEMRTPMNGIMGMTELLSQTELSKEQAEYVKSINLSGNSLMTIIDDILDVTRIQEGKLRTENKVFDLHALIKETHKIFYKIADEKGIDLRLSMTTRVPQYLSNDPERLRQILANLVNNAVKFTNEGYVHIAVDAHKITSKKIKLYIEIQDTGIGISAEHLDNIFDQFLQEDSSLSRRHMGIGLGLSICKQLVQLLDGEIDVESKEGVGSTFLFHISSDIADQPIAPAKKPAISPSTLKNNLNILVAEDNLLNLRLILTVLEKIGYSVDSVTNGKEALEACAKKDYDLIFMDIQMPEMDGFEATQHIRSNTNSTYHQPYIVALTANAFPENRIDAITAGMDEYLTKPLKLALLKQLLFRLENKKVEQLSS